MTKPLTDTASRARQLRAPTVGLRIKEAYEAKGLSRAEFHRRLQSHAPEFHKLNYKTVIDWENGGVPRLQILRAVAAVLEYDLEDISSDPEPADDGKCMSKSPDDTAAEALKLIQEPWLPPVDRVGVDSQHREGLMTDKRITVELDREMVVALAQLLYTRIRCLPVDMELGHGENLVRLRADIDRLLELLKRLDCD